MTRHEFLKPRDRVCLFSISSKPQPIKKKVKKKRFNGLFKVESALSSSSYFTGTPLKYLETNNSSTT